MYIAIKNQKEFPQEEISEISKYLLTERFAKQLAFDFVHRNDFYTRKVVGIGSGSQNLFLIRHSDFSPTVPELNEVHITSYEKYGHINLYVIGEDSSKQSALYWIACCTSENVMYTDNGILMQDESRSKNIPKLLGRFDHLWIAGSKFNTVLALDLGSSHIQS